MYQTIKCLNNPDDVINCQVGRLGNHQVIEKRWSDNKITINIYDNPQASHVEKNEIHKWDSTFYL